MKAITSEVILTSVASRVDGGLSLRMVTPELDSDEKVAFFEAQNKECVILLQPKDREAMSELKEVKGEFDQKTPGQRMRAVLFVLWKQRGEQGDFTDFYRKEMETVIMAVKNQLQPV